MNQTLARTRQFTISRFLRLTEHKTAQRIVDPDGILRLPSLLKKEQVSCVLLVTTAGFMRRGTLDHLLSGLEAADIKVAVFAEVTPDPTIECVEKGVGLYHRESCGALIAVGGGSAMDCAKIIGARVVCPQKSVRQMEGMLKIGKALPPLYAVPTTAGTGSEVTAAAVVTDTVNGKHYKYAVSDLHLIPKVAILDANLTTGLSPEMTAATGMDALTHAVEAYTNKFASPFVRKMARKAVRMIFENLPLACQDGTNLAARQNMLEASCYAGIAFTNNFVGYVHAIAHAVGAMYGVPHGKANAVILPAVLKEYGPSVYKPLSELADCVGIRGNSDEERARLFIERIETMQRETGLPAFIAELKERDYGEIIARAMKEGNPDYPVPAIWDAKNFSHVLRAIAPVKG
ncbi:MAG: iron-containing alcohol dehydrogenase [Oscillibacter sp.]|jgi:alcohol dehydrogenase class IV|nr:iron-containing alcohol dehydrogenase [Oscillibacter sp.]